MLVTYIVFFIDKPLLLRALRIWRGVLYVKDILP